MPVRCEYDSEGESAGGDRTGARALRPRKWSRGSRLGAHRLEEQDHAALAKCGTTPPAVLDQRNAPTYIFSTICLEDSEGAGLAPPPSRGKNISRSAVLKTKTSSAIGKSEKSWMNAGGHPDCRPFLRVTAPWRAHRAAHSRSVRLQRAEYFRLARAVFGDRAIGPIRAWGMERYARMHHYRAGAASEHTTASVCRATCAACVSPPCDER
jgi:hypothetical protein